jgi:uncharacterized membrane protein HdeD (DUF308 family)
MLDMLARNWWVFAVRGAAAIVFGVLAIVWPERTLPVLIALFAAFALVDGASLLISLIRGDPDARRGGWSVAIIGILGVVAGIVAFFLPGLTAISLLYVVAAWSIASGIFQIVAAITLRRQIEGELWMAIGGILSIVFGLYLAIFPGEGLLALVLILGIWAIVFGASSLALAIRLRGLRRSTTAAPA